MKKLLLVVSFLLAFYFVCNISTSNAFLDKHRGQHTSTFIEEEGVRVKILYCGSSNSNEIERFFAREDIKIIKVDIFASHQGVVFHVVIFYKMK